MTTTEGLKLKPPVAAAMEVLAAIPKDSTWDAVMYHLHVRQKIECGLRDFEEGKFIDHDELFEELLKKEDWSDSDHRLYDESVLAKLEHAHAQAEAGMLYDEEEVFAELLSDEDVA